MFSVVGTEVFAKEWKGIVPCVSTRADAEKILGKTPLPINLNIYKYKKSRVNIYYERKDKNNPDKDIVERIYVYPGKTKPLSKYIKKIPDFYKDFRKTELPMKITHVYGSAVYRNWDVGFEIRVQKDDKDVEVVTSLGYFAPNYSCTNNSQDSELNETNRHDNDIKDQISN